MDDDKTRTGNTEPCTACLAGGYPEFCSSEHTPTVLRLATAIDKSLMGPPGHTEAHPEWYIEDAVAIAFDVDEGDGWVIEHDGSLGEFFKVNGVEFYIDVNAEGYSEPELASQERARRAEEAAWEKEVDGG